MTLIDPVEIGRLKMMLADPVGHVERRVEELALKDDHFYAVTVSQQFTVPFHLPAERHQPVERELLIPIGQHVKTRQPDLRVIGPDGLRLPVLGREARGKAIAIVFTSGWEDVFFETVLPRDEHDARVIWEFVQQQSALVVSASSKEGAQTIARLRAFLERVARNPTVPAGIAEGAHRICNADEFWSESAALATSSVRLARMRGVPGRTYVVTVEHTERFSYHEYGKGLLTGFLGWLGWVSVPIYRRVANIGQAASLWIVQSMPEGVEPLRFYWEDRSDQARDSEAIAVERDRVVAGRHADRTTSRPPGEQVLMLDVQIAPSASFTSAIALGAFLVFVSSYVYQQVPDIVGHGTVSAQQTTLVALASVFAAVPATIAGALAYGGQAFARRMTRGPRALLAVLAGLAAFLSIVIGLKKSDPLVEDTSYVLSVYCVFLIGAFGWIQLGPRWRKNGRSRWDKSTSDASPVDCRNRQRYAALAYGLFLLFAVVVFAHCQAVLQHQRVFTDAFPGNIWHAWWSWFGL